MFRYSTFNGERGEALEERLSAMDKQGGEKKKDGRRVNREMRTLTVTSASVCSFS